MKKIFAIVFVLVCAFSVTGITAFADMGPKPSVTVYVRGVESGREYFATLLTDTERLAFDKVYEDGDPDFISNQSEEWRAFYEFSRTDEYNYLQKNFKMSGNGSFSWGYRPPDKFKVLLYFPDDGSLIVSEPQETYAFNSLYNAAVNGGEIVVSRGGSAVGYAAEVVAFLLRIIVTIGLELAVAVMFKYRDKKEFTFIIVVNIITQVLLNIVIGIADYKEGLLYAMLIYIVSEFFVFLIEAVVYAAGLPKLANGTGAGRAVGYAFAANVVSFVVGGIISFMLYGVSDIFAAM